MPSTAELVKKRSAKSLLVHRQSFVQLYDKTAVKRIAIFLKITNRNSSLQINIFLLFLFVLNTLQGLAQSDLSVQYSNQISPDSAYSSIRVLTSDSLEGRETGKPGQKKAAHYIKNRFGQLKLNPGIFGTYEQFHPITLRSCETCNIEVNQQFFLFMKDFYYPSFFTDTILVIDSVSFIGYGITDPSYDDCKNNDIAGKSVIILDGEPKSKKGKYIITKSKHASEWSTDWKKKVEFINEKKPRIVFVITDTIEAMADSFNYSNKPNAFEVSCRQPNAIPWVYITNDLAQKFFPETMEPELNKALRKISRGKKSVNISSSTSAIVKLSAETDKMRGQNIIGYIEGTEKKNESVFITAHYDHLGVRDSLLHPGADDNASGTSAVMELARVFQQAAADGHRPLRNIYFMLVSGEEKGLLGSKYFVKRPPVPLDEIVVDLNIDMIGRTDPKHDSLNDPNYVYIIGSNKLSTELHEISERVNDSITKLHLDYEYNKPGDPNRFYFRSDHYNFAKNNIPVIFYFNGTHSDYHQPGDTADKINTKLLARRARLVFLTAWEVANRKERIRVDQPMPKE